MEDVVVVGAGPTGLWLAGELRLGGASVTVLETRRDRDPNSKALTIHPRTIEIFDCRGIAEPFLTEGTRIPNGHFAGLPDRLDFSVLDTPFPFTLAVVQARTEEVLEARASDGCDHSAGLPGRRTDARRCRADGRRDRHGPVRGRLRRDP